LKSFLKWAGNKHRIVEKIITCLPNGTRLVEPFVGSGVVFMNSNYKSWLLSEKNQDLITLFKILQEEGESFIDYCKTFFLKKNNSSSIYYDLRTNFNETKNKRLKSALFLYLNKHCYNGLCRYNLSGKFNVPFGFYKNVYFPKKEMLYFYELSKKALFKCCDYKEIYKFIKKGDVIYCDPPYIPLSNTEYFTQYGPYKFNENDQEELADFARKLANKGIPVLLSNHDTKFTRELYSGAKIKEINVQRNISCKGSTRRKVKEILALFEG
jgi:DNA adenine methylase